MAYYALLSIVPLLILSVIALSHWHRPGGAARARSAATSNGSCRASRRRSSTSWRNFLDHRDVIGWVLLVTMLFFSSLAFTVLENAMSVIFLHRVAIRRRHFLISALLPYLYILSLGVGLLLVTLVAGSLQAMGQASVELLGRSMVAAAASPGVLLYLLGFTGEVFVSPRCTSSCRSGRLSLRHALIGGVTAARAVGAHAPPAACGTSRRCRRSSVVYGSLTTAIIVLLSLEIGAALLLLGAQVIAEYERLGRGGGASRCRCARAEVQLPLPLVGEGSG